MVADGESCARNLAGDDDRPNGPIVDNVQRSRHEGHGEQSLLPRGREDGVHYFLTQFPEFSGRESIFAELRQYILDDAAPSKLANDFVTKRNHPLLVEMLHPGARPAGWRAHILAAEIKRGECFAHVQTFLTEDWPAPIYTIHLGKPANLPDRAAGHRYVYYADGPKGKFAGFANPIGATRVNIVVPPATPVIRY